MRTSTRPTTTTAKPGPSCHGWNASHEDGDGRGADRGLAGRSPAAAATTARRQRDRQTPAGFKRIKTDDFSLAVPTRVDARTRARPSGRRQVHRGPPAGRGHQPPAGARRLLARLQVAPQQRRACSPRARSRCAGPAPTRVVSQRDRGRGRGRRAAPRVDGPGRRRARRRPGSSPCSRSLAGPHAGEPEHGRRRRTRSWPRASTTSSARWRWLASGAAVTSPLLGEAGDRRWLVRGDRASAPAR